MASRCSTGISSEALLPERGEAVDPCASECYVRSVRAGTQERANSAKTTIDEAHAHIVVPIGPKEN